MTENNADSENPSNRISPSQEPPHKKPLSGLAILGLWISMLSALLFVVFFVIVQLEKELNPSTGFWYFFTFIVLGVAVFGFLVGGFVSIIAVINIVSSKGHLRGIPHACVSILICLTLIIVVISSLSVYGPRSLKRLECKRNLEQLSKDTVSNQAVLSEAEVWSQPVNGIQARFSFADGDICNGTRIITVFLELQNVSDVGNPIYLLYDSDYSIKAELFDSCGKPVSPPRSSSFDGCVQEPFFICLPYNSTIKFDVTANGYGIPKDEKALIGLSSRDWVIKRGDSAEYFLGGTFTAEKPKEPVNKDQCIWTGKIEIPKARVNVLNKK
jgi:hypothetical protein